MEIFQLLDYIDRLEKDAKGSLVAILILGIILKNENTWGYQIKLKLLEITNNNIQINDSTLYTILRSMENQYELVNSHKIDRKRTYQLTKHGKLKFQEIIQFWNDLFLSGLSYFRNLNLDLPETEV